MTVTAGSFQVNAEDLRAHAGSVTGIGGRVDEAKAAAGSTELSGDAWGLMCSFLAGMVRDSYEATTSSIDAMSSALTETASGLRSMAADYDAADEAAALRMADLLGELDR